MTITKNNVAKKTAKEIINTLSTQLNDDNVILTREEKRRIEIQLRRFVRKHNISNINPTLDSLNKVKSFVEDNFRGDKTESKDGITVSISFLNEASNDFQMDLQPRSYQREKVASLEWKIEIMRTVLVDKEYKIPAIHVRILRDDNNKVVGYEIADGQQRVSAILDFMKNKFRLPKGFMVGSTDLGEKNLVYQLYSMIILLMKKYQIALLTF